MNTPLTTKTCPECGGGLAVDSPEGLCRTCLLKRGLETNTVAGSEASEIESRKLKIEKGWVPPAVGELAGLFPELEILELIGRGGMGAVYKAKQKSLDRFVALKILPPEIGRDANFTERFGREARAMARLNHPHIVNIHDFGQRGALYFFLMEFVDGLSLRQILNTGKLSPTEAVCAQRGDRAPGHQAGEYPADEEGGGEDCGLWIGEAGGGAGEKPGARSQ